MKAVCTFVLLLAPAVTAHSAGQVNVSGGAALDQIVVRVLNGKNGKPIRHETLGTLLEAGPLKGYRTDAYGEVVLTISGHNEKEIQVALTNFYIDCGIYGNDDGQRTKFSLDEIASKGIVAENRCGPSRANATPGVLIVYARKMTRKERHLI
jgi:hypothetical protein